MKIGGGEQSAPFILFRLLLCREGMGKSRVGTVGQTTLMPRVDIECFIKSYLTTCSMIKSGHAKLRTYGEAAKCSIPVCVC